MASLFNTKISDTYVGLIKTLDTTAITSTLKELSDGNGNSTGLFINTSGDFKVTAILEWGSLKDTGTGITITNFVDSTATLASNKNDTTIPTSKAVSDYVDTQVGASDLDFSGDSGTGAVILASETFAVTGTTNQIETTASGTGLALSLPSTVHRDLQGNVTGNLTGDVTGNVTGNVTGDLTGDSAGTHTGAVVGDVTGNVTGDLTGNVTATSILADGVTATSQALADDSTKVATTAFVQDVVGTIPAGLVFQGTWNANTNTPTLASGTGTTGHFYIVSVAGTTDLDGVTDWAVGDWAVFVEQGATDQWEKVDNSSVLDGNGTGGKISKWAGSGNSVTLTDSIITESGSNIGIGVSNPTEKFEVDGAILWSGALGASQTSAGVLDRSGDNLRIRAYGATAGSGALQFRTGGGADAGDSLAVTIDSSQAIQFNSYGAGTLVSDASGNITSISGGGEGGPYLPLAGGTLTGNLLFGDNVQARFGASDDLQIYHDAGGDSYIKELGTGQFYIQAENFRFKSSDGASTLITANVGGAVSLYYDNSKKFETTSSGVDVTGAINAANANLTGALNINNTLPTIKLTDIDNSAYARIRASNGGLLFEADEDNTQTGTGIRFEIDGSEQMRIFNNNVGIGITSPTEKLSVDAGTANNVARFYSSDDTAQIIIKDDDTTMYFGVRNSTAFITPTGGTPQDGLVVDTNGQVGIGTASPSATLELNSDIANAAKLKIGRLVGLSNYLELGTSGGDSVINAIGVAGTNGSLVFNRSTTTTTTESMRIDSAGNVLVGKTSNLVSQDGVQAEQSGLFAATRDGNNVAYFNRRTSDGSVIELRKDNTAVGVIGTEKWGIGTSSPSATLNVVNNSGGWSTYINNDVGSGTQSGLLLDAGSNSSDFAMYVRNAAATSDLFAIKGNGSVGIGTDTPSSLLEIQTSSTSGSADFQIFSRGESPNYEVLKISRSAGDAEILSNQNLTLSADYDNNHTGANSNIKFKTDNTERMRIDSAGNLGIGTGAAVDANLHVVGTDIKLQGIGIAGDLTFAYNAGNNSTTVADVNYANINATVTSGSTGSESGKLSFQTRNAGTVADRMTIDSSGEVKINKSIHLGSDSGVVTPQDNHMLIESPSGGTTQLGMYVHNASFFSIKSDGTTANIGWGSSQSREINFQNTGTGDIKIGIGTASPARILHIESDTTAAIQLENTSEADSFIDFQNPSRTFRVGYDDSTDLFKIAVTNFNDNSLVVNSAGDVLIGTTTRANGYNATFTTLAIKSRVGDTASILELRGNRSQNAGNQNSMIQFFNETSTATEVGRISSIQGSATNSGEITFMTSNAGTIAERMRITSSGNVLVGKTTDDDNTNGVRLAQGGIISASRASNVALILNRTGSDGNIALIRNDGTQVGSISVSGSATAYNTSSDYRLKENVVEMTGALDRVAQLKPSRFNFIADTDKVVDGFLAHEVQSVVPEAITGTKDAVDEEGNPEYQGIDQSKLVPLLVGAIQELRAEIELLKAK